MRSNKVLDFCLGVIVLLGIYVSYDRAPKAPAQTSSADVGATSQPEKPAVGESKERLEHLAHLQQINKCFEDDCWGKRTELPVFCRMSLQFNDVRELYHSVTLPVSPAVADLIFGPNDPRLQVDMQRLEQAWRRSEMYLDWLIDTFRDNVDKKFPIPNCGINDPTNLEVKPPFHRDTLTNRIMEVSEDLGLRGIKPTKEQLKSMIEFVAEEQAEIYEQGPKTKERLEEACSVIEAFFEDPTKYLPCRY